MAGQPVGCGGQLPAIRAACSMVMVRPSSRSAFNVRASSCRSSASRAACSAAVSLHCIAVPVCRKNSAAAPSSRAARSGCRRSARDQARHTAAAAAPWRIPAARAPLEGFLGQLGGVRVSPLEVGDVGKVQLQHCDHFCGWAGSRAGREGFLAENPGLIELAVGDRHVGEISEDAW